MSDNFWKRLSTIFGYMVLVATFGVMIFVANMEIKDLDLWLHIGVGRYIVQNGFSVPSADILSCTMAGKPWVNHEWLFQVMVYYIHHFSGPDGLITMQVILVTVTLLILLLLAYNKEKQLAVVFSLLLVSLVYYVRFTIRPDLFSLLFFTLYILILSFHMSKRWAIYALVAVQVLWTNMHGFFFFGPLFVLISLFAEWVKRHVRLPYEWNSVGRLTDEEYRRLGFIFIFVALACLLNPLTFRGAWYPISIFFQISGDSKVFFDKIIELQKPITLDNLFSPADSPYYKLLIIISFISFVFNRYRLDISALMFWVIFLFFSLAAIRNVVFFAFAAHLAFLINVFQLTLEDFIPFQITDRRFVHIVSCCLKIFLLVWILQLWTDISTNGYFDFDTYERKSEFGGVSLRTYPDKAADFLVENDVRGNFYNDFNAGAYLVGRCSPNIKVFIDGRTELYGPDFFKEYIKICEKDDLELFKKAVARYRLTGVLLSLVQQPAPPRIINYLYDNKEWVPVYFNYDAVIFLKDCRLNKEVIAKHRLDLTKWETPKMDIYRLGSKKVTAYQYVNRAYTFEALGLDRQAIGEIDEALRVTPAYREPYKLLGKIFAKHKSYQDAFENFRVAVIFDPNDRESRMNLALAYYDLGQYKYAIDQYSRVVENWPEKPESYFLLARCYIKAKQYNRALAQIQRAHQVDPKDAQDLLRLGDMFYDDGLLKEAEEVYRMVTMTGQPQGEMLYKLGRVYYKLGQKDRAKTVYGKAVQLEPGNRLFREDFERVKTELP